MGNGWPVPAKQLSVQVQNYNFARLGY